MLLSCFSDDFGDFVLCSIEIMLLYAGDVSLYFLMDFAYFFELASVVFQFYSVDVLTIYSRDMLWFLFQYVAPGCIRLLSWVLSGLRYV